MLGEVGEEDPEQDQAGWISCDSASSSGYLTYMDSTKFT